MNTLNIPALDWTGLDWTVQRRVEQWSTASQLRALTGQGPHRYSQTADSRLQAAGTFSQPPVDRLSRYKEAETGLVREGVRGHPARTEMNDHLL